MKEEGGKVIVAIAIRFCCQTAAAAAFIQCYWEEASSVKMLSQSKLNGVT
jgi:hypothetical protein